MDGFVIRHTARYNKAYC